MLLENKRAAIHGAGAAIGDAVARTLALEAVTKDGASDRRVAETAQVDARDEQSVEQHADEIAGNAGGIDLDPPGRA